MKVQRMKINLVPPKEPILVYVLMEEVDPIAVYYNKLDAQNDALKYELHNWNIIARELT